MILRWLLPRHEEMFLFFVQRRCNHQSRFGLKLQTRDHQVQDLPPLTHDCSRIHLASWTRSRRRINRRHRGITSSNHFWFCLPTSSLISHHIHRTSQTRVYWSFLKKYGTSAHTLGCKPPIPSQIGTVGAFVELSLAGVDDEVEASFWTSLADFVALLLVMAMVFQHLLYPAP